jgi:hypothetical protein
MIPRAKVGLRPPAMMKLWVLPQVQNMDGNQASGARGRGQTLGWFLGIVVALGGVAVLPSVIVPSSVVADAEARVKLQNDVRTTLLQGVGGLVVLLGAYLTWRQIDLSRRQLQHTLEANNAGLELSRRTHVTEQFSRATDQLGHDRPGARIAAIYTLEQIAATDMTLRRAIHELLAAYVRSEAPWTHHDPVTLTAVEPDPASTPATLPVLKVRIPDVHTAMQVLARRPDDAEEIIDLQGGVDLRGVQLNGTNLRRVNLGRGALIGAELVGINLSHAFLRRVSFRRAWLISADLTGSNLCDADFRQADLTGANLTDADLTNALYDVYTQWPDGFDPSAAGALYSS